MSRIRRVVLLVIDGLRPDVVSSNLMPSLAALAAAGWSCEGRTVRPSVTVAALTSLATGVSPARHGLVEARLPRLGGLGELRPLPQVLPRRARGAGAAGLRGTGVGVPRRGRGGGGLRAAYLPA